MVQISFLLVVLLAHTAAAAVTSGGEIFSGKSVRVTVHESGRTDVGVQVQIGELGFNVEALLQFLGKAIGGVRKHFLEKRLSPVRVVNAIGAPINSFESLQNGDHLFLIGPGLNFFWPAFWPGHEIVTEIQGRPGANVSIRCLSAAPRVFYISNFFTDEEAVDLINSAQNEAKDGNAFGRSTVGVMNSKRSPTGIRTSENAFVQLSDTAMALKNRAFKLLRIPFNNDLADGIQVLRYKQKQAYITHDDWFEDGVDYNFNWQPAKGGSNRFATVFLYLSNVDEGGQTVFALADMPHNYTALGLRKHKIPAGVDNLFEEGSWERKMVDQCYSKLAVYPKKGDAILFYNQKPHGEMDSDALHGGCPVINGTKWAANLWVWNDVRYGVQPNDPGKGFRVQFKNEYPHPVSLRYAGTELEIIPANDIRAYNTFVGHQWQITYEDKLLWEHVIKKTDYETVFTVTPGFAIDIIDELEKEL